MLELKGESIEKIISEKGEVFSSTSGTSMYPMLRHRRDMVIVKKVDRPLRKNDVVLYRTKGGKLLLHRILRVDNEMCTIRGDNLYYKEYNKSSDIIGVLNGFYRNNKFYNCDDDKRYKCYIFFMHLGYPFRYFWKVLMLPFMVKCKHLIFGKPVKK